MAYAGRAAAVVTMVDAEIATAAESASAEVFDLWWFMSLERMFEESEPDSDSDWGGGCGGADDDDADCMLCVC